MPAAAPTDDPAILPRITERFRPLSESGRDLIRDALLRDMFSRSSPGHLQTAQGRTDLDNHLFVRLESDRREVIPWLDDAFTLDGARILEIGCGTGASSVALAEQGVIVTATDIDEPSLRVAKCRWDAYDLNIRSRLVNATNVHESFAGEQFDAIIFWAALEHMIHRERLTAMTATWNMLAPGACWCVIEAPNRLWYKDTHTSLLPFFMWLPDDLAFDYARFSPRDGFRNQYPTRTDEAMLAFLRRGRGVSFHEFDLTLGPASGLDVISSKAEFQQRGFTPEQRDTYLQSSTHRFSTQLAAMARTADARPMHDGFFQPMLDLVIRKH